MNLNEDVQRKIELANDSLNGSYNVIDYSTPERQILATQALAEAVLAVAYGVAALSGGRVREVESHNPEMN